MSARSLRSVRDSFLRWIENNRRPRTAENYQRYIDRFIVAVGNLPIERVKHSHLSQWGKTWHEIQALQRFFAWIVNEAELLPVNPLRRVQRPRLGCRKRILDRRAMARFLRQARPEFRAFMLAMRETMARPQEIRELVWGELWEGDNAAERETVLVTGQALFILADFKARDRRADPDAQRILPISPRLGRLLLRLRARRPVTRGEIFRNIHGEPWTRNALRLRMNAVRRRLGITKDHRGETVCNYTLRHSMATLATKAGVRDRTLADLLGHTSTRTTARYQHLDVQHLVDAMALVRSRNRPTKKG